MLYDDKHAYLRLQKCASTYVKTALNNNGICTRQTSQNHDNRRTSSEVERLCQDRFCFTLVRHPLDWLGSIWRFRNGQGWGTHQELDDCRHETFDGFVVNYLEKHPGFVSELFEEFTGPEHAPLVDFIGYAETPVESLRRLFSLIELPFQEELLPEKRLNVSRTPSRHSLYRRDLRDAVTQAEAKAIERFKYPLWEEIR